MRFPASSSTSAPSLAYFWCLLLLATVNNSEAVVNSRRATSNTTTHTANYAVIVSSSRYWFNYRHASNAFSIYQLLKEQGGFTDDEIILMVADDYAVNPRNPVKNALFNTATDAIDPGRPLAATTLSLVSPDTIIDYRSEDVTVENFLRVLTGQRGDGHRPVLHPSQTQNANILLYLTGHGGDQFFKFQDVEEVTAQELAEAFMNRMEFRNLLVVADTCQAFTLAHSAMQMSNSNNKNVAVLGSSLKGQSSYAHAPQPVLGLAMIEKYTHFFVQRAKSLYASKEWDTRSVRSVMVEGYPKAKLGGAEIGLWDETCDRDMSQVPLADFFRNVAAKSPQLPKVQPIRPSQQEYRARHLERAHALNMQDTTDEIARSENTEWACGRDGRGSKEAATSGSCLADNIPAPKNTTHHAMEPNDPWFLAIVTCIVTTILLASQRW